MRGRRAGRGQLAHQAGELAREALAAPAGFVQSAAAGAEQLHEGVTAMLADRRSAVHHVGRALAVHATVQAGSAAVFELML